MSFVLPSRRRAEEFHATLEGSREASSAHAEALALVGALRRATPVEPRADFVTDLRGRLMAEADSALAAGLVQQAPTRDLADRRVPKRERRLAAAVGSFALVGATASMAVAAQGALPGETLYPLKRALENAQAGVQPDVDGKGATILANATGRLDEVDRLSRDAGAHDPVVISSTLEAFTEQASQAAALLMEAYEETGRPELIDDVRVFASQSMESLRDLEPLVPRESRAALISASQVLRQIDQAAMEACPTCSAAFIDQAPLLAASTYSDLITGMATNEPAPHVTTGTGIDKPKEPRKKPAKDTETLPGSGPAVPVSTEAPTSVSPGATNNDSPQPGAPRNPVKDLTEGLLGGGNGNTNGPRLGEVVEETVKDLTDPLLP